MDTGTPFDTALCNCADCPEGYNLNRIIVKRKCVSLFVVFMETSFDGTWVPGLCNRYTNRMLLSDVAHIERPLMDYGSDWQTLGNKSLDCFLLQRAKYSFTGLATRSRKQ